MNLLYNIGITCYIAALKLAARCGHRKARQMEEGRKHWCCRLREQREQGARYIWFHAASLGEFEQGRPLMEHLRLHHPEYKILLTFFSPSGYEVRKNYAGADIICYLPYDFPETMRRFLDIARPEKAFFIKYEFWGNALAELHRRNIPTYLISGIFRPHQCFFRWYGGFMRSILRHFTHFYVQDEESCRLLQGIGCDNVTVSGDTRFDRVLAIREQAKVLSWAEQFVCGHRGNVIVAGSTWPKDEEILLDHFNRHPELKLIIAPHEIHEEHIAGIMERLKRPYMRYSALDEARLQEVDCLIIDAIGFLSSIYRYGDLAYVGGGFGVGIHNTLEASVYGIPVAFGPNHQAFREALGLIAVGGAFPICDLKDWEKLMETMQTDRPALQQAGKSAGAYVHDQAGATATILKGVF